MNKYNRPYSRNGGQRFTSFLPKLGLVALVCSSSVSLFAQDGEDEEDIFVLSPFEVDTSEDSGWRSSNSTAGTTLNTAIKDIPMSIEVINSDFLDDIQADTFDEALQYSAGVNLELFESGAGSNSPNEVGSSEKSSSTRGGIGGRFTNGTNIRGFSVPFQNRLGFRYGGSIASFGVNMGGLIDNVNTGRMEVVRGPNSLLYGIGVLSGIVNVMPKKPLSQNSGSASISVGSNNYYRRTFDWTGPIVKDLAGGELNYRFAMAETRSGNETDVYEENKDYYVGQLEYRSDKLSVFLELQHADVKQVGIGSSDLGMNVGKDRNFQNMYDERYSTYRYHSLDGDFWNDKGYITGGEDYVADLRARSDLSVAEYRDVEYDYGSYSETRSALSESEFHDMHYLGYVEGLQSEIDAIEADMSFLDLPSNSTEYKQAAWAYEEKKRHLREYQDNVALYERVGPYDPNFKLIGSDAWASLDESDITFDVNYTPIENLTITVGAFLTDLEETTFSPSASVITNGGVPDGAFNNFFNPSADNYKVAQRQLLRLRNGETLNEEEQLAVDNFTRAEEKWSQYITTFETPAYYVNQRDPDYLDNRYVKYNWNLNPKDTSTEQYRGRVAYNFETPDFIGGSKAKHMLSVGFSYIHDEAQFIAGDELGTGAKSDTTDEHFTGTSGLYPIDTSITQFRNITDFSPLTRNEDDPTRLPGGYAWNVDVWYRSAYGIYTGNFFDDKLMLMAGYRYDEFYTRTQLYDRFDENAPFLGEASYDDWLATLVTESGTEHYPVLDGIGRDPVAVAAQSGSGVYNPYRPLAAALTSNDQVWADPYNRFNYEFRPWATNESQSEWGPGDKAPSETSVTLAANYDITDDVTVYAVSSGGVTPNIGYVDGNADPFPSEKTKNLEVGLKFELFDNKLSGSLSVYEITRENAIWTVSGAPNPAAYWGGVANTEDNEASARFNPQKVIEAMSYEGDDTSISKYRINYGVHQKVFKDAVTYALEDVFADPASGMADIDFQGNSLPLNPYEDGYDRDNAWKIDTLNNYVEQPDGSVETVSSLPDGIKEVYGISTAFIDYASLDGEDGNGIPVVIVNNNPNGTNAEGGRVKYQTQFRFTGGDEVRFERQEAPRAITDVYYIPYRLTTRDILEQAFQDRERETTSGATVARGVALYEEYTPFMPQKQDAGQDENSSRSSGIETSFTDVATGFDAQLQYQVTKAWQMMFTYAHTKREAQGAFQMVDPAFVAEDGETYYFGTEYDTFVRTFGRENYGLENVYKTDPETGEILLDANGNKRIERVVNADGSTVNWGDVKASTATGGIDGLSLYYGYKDQASLYQKYTFMEGVLKDLSIGLGVVYQGPANTSLEKGGNGLLENKYRTPDLPSRIQSNMNISYKWKWADMPLRATLSISNLGNSTHVENVVKYYNELLDQDEYRRTEKYYAPRSYRFSLSTTF